MSLRTADPDKACAFEATRVYSTDNWNGDSASQFSFAATGEDIKNQNCWHGILTTETRHIYCPGYGK